MLPKEVNELIKNRRAIFPKVFNSKPIDHKIIWQLLENANYAPTHRFTEPWRFKVFTGASKHRFAQFLADGYKELTPEENFKPSKYEKTLKKAEQTYAMIAICMRRDPERRVPEVEEICAVACAVQNIWLSAHAYGVGMYWSSPKICFTPKANVFLGLEKEDKCLGLIYMGYHDLPQLPPKRSPIEEKVQWFE